MGNGGHFHTSRIDQFTTTSTFCCWCIISRCLSVLVCWHFPRLYLKTIYPPKNNKKTTTKQTPSSPALSHPLYVKSLFSPQAPYSSDPSLHWQPLLHPAPPSIPVFWPDCTFCAVFLTYFHLRHPILPTHLYIGSLFSTQLHLQYLYSDLTVLSVLFFWPTFTSGTLFLQPICALAASSPPSSTVSTCILTRPNFWHHFSDLLSPKAPYSVQLFYTVSLFPTKSTQFHREYLYSDLIELLAPFFWPTFTWGALFCQSVSTLAAFSPPRSTFNTCILTRLYYRHLFSDPVPLNLSTLSSLSGEQCYRKCMLLLLCGSGKKRRHWRLNSDRLFTLHNANTGMNSAH